MPIHRKFGSEISLSSMLIQEEEELATRAAVDEKELNCRSTSSNTLETLDSVSSFDCCETDQVLLPKSILKAFDSKPSVNGDVLEESLQAWIHQPIPDIAPRRRHRERRSTSSTANKYDRVKTRFPGREPERRERSRRAGRQRPQKTPEEQWVKTCRFLW